MAKTMPIYEVIYEDLSHLGGPMGTEYTTEHSLGLFSTLDKAKAKAERSYKHPLEWLRDGDGFRTEDLGYVMYHICARHVDAKLKPKPKPKTVKSKVKAKAVPKPKRKGKQQLKVVEVMEEGLDRLLKGKA